MLNTGYQAPPGRLQIIAALPGFTAAEYTAGSIYRDGFEIRVWWEAEPSDSPHHPGYWCARLTGTTAEDGPLGTGDSRENALFSLCCSLAALANSLDDTRDDPA